MYQNQFTVHPDHNNTMPAARLERVRETALRILARFADVSLEVLSGHECEFAPLLVRSTLTLARCRCWRAGYRYSLRPS